MYEYMEFLTRLKKNNRRITFTEVVELLGSHISSSELL